VDLTSDRKGHSRERS